VNPLILLPFGLLVVPFIPTLFEFLKRKDKGPKDVPDQTTYEEKPDLEVSRLEKARGKARAKAPGDVIRITGDVSIPEGTDINNHLVVQGNLKVGRKSHIYGSIKAFGDVEIGESTIVDGHVLSEGKVTIERDCIIKGVVDSLKDIVLKENAVIEAVSTEKTVSVGPNARINRRILSGASIITAPQPPKEETPEQLEKPELPPPPPVIKEAPTVVEEAKPALPVEKKLEKEAELIREAVPFEVLDPTVGHLYLYAPTRYGKTYMIWNYIIPYLRETKKIVVIDPHREYAFEPYEVDYDKTIPDVESDLFKTFITFNVWGDVDRIINEMINRVAQSKGNLSIRPNILDSNVEKLIISEFLKRITQLRWKTPLLLIVEEADKYEVLSAVTRGRHANIQVILTSAKRLMPEVFSNAHLVLGSVNPLLIKDYDLHAAEVIASLGKYEFLWEKDYHDWRRFRLGEQPSPTEPAPQRIEEPKPVFRMPVRPTVVVEQPVSVAEVPTLKELEEAGRITDQIFGFLEERIRMLDEAKRAPVEALNLQELNPTEARVLRATSVGRSIEEICLRLLMDPTEVRETIDRLIDKGYLDENLRPRISQVRKPSEPAAPKTVLESEIQTKPVIEQEEELSEDDLIERLIASKMREELKRKIEAEVGAESKETKEDKPEFFREEEGTVLEASSGEIKDILKEWEEASQQLWATKAEEEKPDIDDSKTSENNEPAETHEDTVDKNHLSTDSEAESTEDGDDEKPSFPPHKTEEKSSSSQNPARERLREFFKSTMSMRAGLKPVPSVGTFVLPVLTLLALLLAEIAYYTPYLVVFLENILPFNIKVWLVFSAMAVGFGFASGFFFLEHLMNGEKISAVSQRRN